MGNQRNSLFANIIAWGTSVIMILMTSALLYTQITGRQV
jgi:hypothetical protein